MSEKQKAKIIVLTGVESSGKTTLAKLLAAHYNEPLVLETARTYLENTMGAYQYNDLEIIARRHKQQIEAAWPKANKFLFVDTAFIVLKIWSEEKFQQCCPFILNTIASFQPDAYILCDRDIAWEYDILRETVNDFDRARLHANYLAHLQEQSSPFIVVSGSKSERLEKVVSFLEEVV